MCTFSIDEQQQQTLINSKTPICTNSEVFAIMDQNPVSKSVVVENPSTDFANSDGNVFEETLEFGGNVGVVGLVHQIEIPVEESNEIGGISVRDAQLDETLKFDETPVVKTLEIGGNVGDVGEIKEIEVLDTERCELDRVLVKEGVRLEENLEFGGNVGENKEIGDVLLDGNLEECNNNNNNKEGDELDSIFCDETLGGFDEGDYDSLVVPESKFYGSSRGFGEHRWSVPEPCPVGAGLSNLGNTCFLNAIMQCFTHTVPLVEGLQSIKHDASSHGEGEFCVLCAVRDQIEQSLICSGKIISPYNLVDNLYHISSFFRRYQQEDAHEFLQCLLDKLDSNWSKHGPNAGKPSQSRDSLVKQVFGGRLVSQLHCCKCGHNSDSYEPMIDLSLEIEDVDDLESALRSFTKVENLEDSATCDNCKEKVQRKKQLLLDQAPPIAALHLKRFKSDGEKIDNMVKYPLELDLHPYTKGATDVNEDLKYELYGFVMHNGFSSTIGHYFCYIRTSPDAWYKFDDSKVTRVSETTALDQEAYLLFYARKGTSKFSDLLEKWNTGLEEKSNTSPKSVLDIKNLSSTYAEPVSCLRFDEHMKEDPVDTQEPAVVSTSVASSPIKPIHGSMSADKPEISVGVNHWNDVSVSNTENHFGDNPKYDAKLNLPASAIPWRFDLSDDDEPAIEVKFQIPVAHIKIQEKASSSVKNTVKKAKEDPERKEAARYLKSSSMPIGRRQMLMAAISSSQTDSSSKNGRTYSSLSEKQLPRKRVKSY